MLALFQFLSILGKWKYIKEEGRACNDAGWRKEGDTASLGEQGVGCSQCPSGQDYVSLFLVVISETTKINFCN
jgi:hypothetical protein